jgi:hypothetical protein
VKVSRCRDCIRCRLPLLLLRLINRELLKWRQWVLKDLFHRTFPSWVDGSNFICSYNCCPHRYTFLSLDQMRDLTLLEWPQVPILIYYGNPPMGSASLAVSPNFTYSWTIVFINSSNLKGDSSFLVDEAVIKFWHCLVGKFPIAKLIMGVPSRNISALGSSLPLHSPWKRFLLLPYHYTIKLIAH